MGKPDDQDGVDISYDEGFYDGHSEGYADGYADATYDLVGTPACSEAIEVICEELRVGVGLAIEIALIYAAANVDDLLEAIGAMSNE